MTAKAPIALSIEGDLDLDALATAVSSLKALIAALADEYAPDDRFIWRITELSAGSAHIGIGAADGDTEGAQRVIERYAALAADLALGKPMDQPAAISRPAKKIVRLNENPGVRGVVFAANGSEHRVSAATITSRRPLASTYTDAGSVQGEVAAISRNGGLSLMLREDLTGASVKCRLREDQEEEALAAWRSGYAIVTGEVRYSAQGGPPKAMTDVKKIEPLDEDAEWEAVLARARGAFPWKPGDEPAEVTIRRLRDAW